MSTTDPDRLLMRVRRLEAAVQILILAVALLAALMVIL